MNDYSFLLKDGSLAQGSAPPPGADLPFDTIVLSAIEYQIDPRYFPDREVLHVPLTDHGPPPTDRERELIYENAQRIARRIRKGRRVLVTCRQGRNRSGVLAGLALVELGVPGPRAAELIQRIRNGLTNTHFLQMVIDS